MFSGILTEVPDTYCVQGPAVIDFLWHCQHLLRQRINNGDLTVACNSLTNTRNDRDPDSETGDPAKSTFQREPPSTYSHMESAAVKMVRIHRTTKRSQLGQQHNVNNRVEGLVKTLAKHFYWILFVRALGGVEQEWWQIFPALIVTVENCWTWLCNSFHIRCLLSASRVHFFITFTSSKMRDTGWYLLLSSLFYTSCTSSISAILQLLEIQVKEIC